MKVNLFTPPSADVRQVSHTVTSYITSLEEFLSLTFSPEAPAYLIDLMHDKNTEIRKVCDNTLDIIAVSETHTLVMRTHRVAALSN